MRDQKLLEDYFNFISTETIKFEGGFPHPSTVAQYLASGKYNRFKLPPGACSCTDPDGYYQRNPDCAIDGDKWK